MNRTLRDPAVAESPAIHPEMCVTRAPEGGFDLTPASGEEIHVRPEGDAWAVRTGEADCRWSLVRGREVGEGFRLMESDGKTEAGRTASLDQVETGASVDRSVLLGDGRLFRIVLRGPADARYEIVGWETPGAYLTARISDRGWTVQPEAACSGLREIRPLAILLAAELLDSET